MKKKKFELKILNTEPSRLSSCHRSTLNSLAEVDEIEATRTFLNENIWRYDGIFIGLSNTFDQDLLKKAKRLKFIVTPTTGLTHIDENFAEKVGIKVLSLRGEVEFLTDVSATAELAWGAMLALIRKIPSACNSVTGGEWKRDDFYGVELSGKTIGIIGFGRLGKKIANYANAFNMRVTACDPKPDHCTSVEFVTLSELIKNSDFISINVDLNPTTIGLLGEKEFNIMKTGAFLINTARGEVIDESVMLDHLQSRRLAGAAIDVMIDEKSQDSSWLTKSPLIDYAKKHDNLIITPHIGGVTKESVEKTNGFIIAKLAKYLENLE